MADYKTKILIIGSGPAGYTAGIYAARAGLKPLLVSGNQPGGQLTMTTSIENFPGFKDPQDGTMLMETMKEQALALGVEMINDRITTVDTSKRPFICESENNNHYEADAIIIATGSSARWLGLESEEKFRGFGISACATCDGFFYRNKDVAVIGGGNTAIEDALYLTNFAKHVTVIHRRDELRADKASQQRLFANEKVSVIWDSVVSEFIGTDQPKSLTGLKIKNVKTGELSDLTVDGVFIAVGHHPNTEVFKNKLELSEDGYIQCKPDSCETNIKGIYAAGDVRNGNWRQAVVAAGSGCVAALEAEKFLSSNEK